MPVEGSERAQDGYGGVVRGDYADPGEHGGDYRRRNAMSVDVLLDAGARPDLAKLRTVTPPPTWPGLR